MSLENYGVLKGKPKDCKCGKGKNAHYQILVRDGRNEHRVAVNVSSRVPPSELLYFVDDDFNHPLTAKLEDLEMGFHKLDRRSRDICLDYVRGGLFDTSKMVPLKYDVPGPSNDLNELIRKYVKQAVSMSNSVIYAFGEKWGPESFLPDSFFGFRPGSGIRDVHMNQGNSMKWQSDDAPCQDGGLLIHLPENDRWIAIFLAFRSQCFNTDDSTGHCLPDGKRLGSESCAEPHAASESAFSAGSVKITAALVNPLGVDTGKETVTLFNASPDDIDLDGWFILDGQRRKSLLRGTIKAGSGIHFLLSGNGAVLPNDGGEIGLYDDQGILMHEVKYTGREVRKGWTIVF